MLYLIVSQWVLFNYKNELTMLQQLKITFYLYAYRTNSRGEAPVFCKIAMGENRKQFSTSVFVSSSIWDKDSQRVRGVDEEALLINRKLQEVYTQLIRIEKQLYDEGERISLETIYNRYRGKETEQTICSVFEDRIAHMKGLVGDEGGYSHSTLQKFMEVYAHARTYIQKHYNRQDIPLKQLNYAFIKGFEEYLLGRKLKPITINKIIQRVRQMVLYGVKCGYIVKDPFVDYKPLKEKKQLVFLTDEELKRLEEHSFAQERLEEVKHLYLFSVYTGLAYNEAHSLQSKHIVKGFDGRNWIHITRKKTDREVSIPLLPQAEAILERFKGSDDEYLLPRITNQKVNSYLREISEIVGISKKLTHHTARKTFASTILLYNDVPIEIVSALLGHSDISVTQRSYAQVINKNISNHMDKLQKKLK